MCKAVDREMVFGAIRLVHKSRGKSGTFQRAWERSGRSEIARDYSFKLFLSNLGKVFLGYFLFRH